jgi:hypothetical protein
VTVKTFNEIIRQNSFLFASLFLVEDQLIQSGDDGTNFAPLPGLENGVREVKDETLKDIIQLM